MLPKENHLKYRNTDTLKVKQWKNTHLPHHALEVFVLTAHILLVLAQKSFFCLPNGSTTHSQQMKQSCTYNNFLVALIVL